MQDALTLTLAYHMGVFLVKRAADEDNVAAAAAAARHQPRVVTTMMTVMTKMTLVTRMMTVMITNWMSTVKRKVCVLQVLSPGSLLL
jgi:hypothetical protein